jgi:hypothetical protein
MSTMRRGFKRGGLAIELRLARRHVALGATKKNPGRADIVVAAHNKNFSV